MARGHKVTEREILHIGRLASYVDADGTWKLSYVEIARQLDLDPQTISEIARQALVWRWEQTRWRPPDCPDSA